MMPGPKRSSNRGRKRRSNSRRKIPSESDRKRPSESDRKRPSASDPERPSESDRERLVGSDPECPSESDRERQSETYEETVDQPAAKRQKSDRRDVHWQATTLWTTIHLRFLGAESIDEARYVNEELEYEFGLSGDELSLTRTMMRDRILSFQMAESRRKLWDDIFKTKECRDRFKDLKSRELEALFLIQDTIRGMESDDLFFSQKEPSYVVKNRELWKQLTDWEGEREELEKKLAELESERRRTLKIYEEQTYEVMKVREENRRAFLKLSDSLMEAEGGQPSAAPGCLVFI